MAQIRKEQVNKLLWLDMEMTGLDVDKEVPIEVACLITDWQFNELAQFHRIFKQPQKYLDAMDDWNKKTHGESGLLAKIPGGDDPAAIDKDLATLIGREFGFDRAVLAGNSINQDRLFIRKYMPLTEAALHYRQLDVTSWKVVYNALFQKKFEKKQAHRAIDDIRESIDEFKFYLSFVKP